MVTLWLKTDLSSLSLSVLCFRTTVVLEKQDNEAFGFEVQVRSLPHFSFSQEPWWVTVSVWLSILFLSKVEVRKCRY